MPNLVGIGLSQVPTNSMLGGLAYQSPDHASIKDLDLKNLSQINSEIADTAVDIFIYDTSKDSDGGAWRKRTTHTSWYNETLNTATRGSRREFPAVAVLVLESTQLTIYDGDDPDLPMWMVFDRASSAGWTPNTTNIFGVSYSTFTSISMLNGIFAMGADYASDNSNGVLIKVSFIEDTGYFHSIQSVSASYPAGGFGRYRGSIAERDSGKGHSNINDTDKIVNVHVNDVAMTVLPNAPIDSATGLPVPTIAVATDGGVSVIKDDGNVYDFTNATVPNTNFVNFFKDKISFGADAGSAVKWVQFLDIPTADVAYAFNSSTTNWYNNYYGIGSSSDTIVCTPAFTVNTNLSAHLVDSKNNLAYFGSGYGLGVRATLEESAPRMLSYVTSSWTSGYVVGKIKGAFLSDTDSTNATDSNVVNNGTFDSNTSGWFGDSGASISWDSGGFASVGNGGGDNTFAIAQSGILVSGAKYRVTGRVQPSMSGSYEFRVRAGGSGTQWNITSGLTNGQWYSFDTGIITADGTVLEIGSSGGTITNFYLDDVYVWKLEEEDRSVNNTGLEVHGTITKSAVATGAELVAYSGFSGSNYLQQPYNSDLDFGTGDFSVMGWLKCATDGNGLLLSRSTDGGGTGFYWYVGSTGVISTRIGTGGGAIERGTTRIVDTNVWTLLTVVRRSGVVYVYLDAVLDNSFTVSGNINSTAPLQLGGGDPNMSLWRISASAPSAEQIKKIYEDEKMLFQENAACTLYGSSDAVTALAYDDSNSILSVGTSSGRSDFQGLRRINNTTTAVTTAISAHDEFIVEQ